MDLIKIKATRSTFWDWVDKALHRRKIKENLAVEEYLVSLLEKFLNPSGSVEAGQADRAPILSAPLLIELHKCLERGGIDRFARIRDIGDASLFMAGIFGPHLGKTRPFKEGSLLGIRDYVEVGERAYKVLFLSLDISNNLSVVYHYFSRDLGPFVRILNEVSAEHMFSADLRNILFVYARYAATKDPEDAKWLIERGVVLIDGPDPGKLIVQ